MPFPTRENNWIKLPKVGQEYDYSPHGAITEIKEVKSSKGFNFKKREEVILPDGSTGVVDKDLGFHYDIVFEDGKILSISQWAVYYAMQKADVKEGTSIKILHPEKGSWDIEIL